MLTSRRAGLCPPDSGCFARCCGERSEREGTTIKGVLRTLWRDGASISRRPNSRLQGALGFTTTINLGCREDRLCLQSLVRRNIRFIFIYANQPLSHAASCFRINTLAVCRRTQVWRERTASHQRFQSDLLFQSTCLRLRSNLTYVKCLTRRAMNFPCFSNEIHPTSAAG